MFDELALIASAQGGDLEAFNQLVVHYQTIIYNVAYRILGDVDAAADAAQEAFISAYKAIDRFRGGSFKGWLMRIATNACYDQLRVKKRRPTAPLDAVLYTDPEETRLQGEREQRPEEYVDQQELGDLIQRGLNTLPPEQRAVLILSDIQEMQYDEIAEALGVSLGTVKSRLNRARGKLRDFMQGHTELLPARYRLENKGGGVAGLAYLLLEWMGVRWLGGQR
ncbi:MAG: sigma-70 family RNA polymerase sigma factor [Anaerolineae bacterium]|nr:sigma-70 family RNA polymerase sigma factor [Anaerolineae bacterium]